MTEYNDSNEERILNVLEKHDRISYNKLHKYTGMGDNKFASTIKRLKNAKQIKNEIRITYNGKVTSNLKGIVMTGPTNKFVDSIGTTHIEMTEPKY